MMPSIKEQLSKKIEKIEQTIDFYLPEEKGLQKTVLSAMSGKTGNAIVVAIVLPSLKVCKSDIFSFLTPCADAVLFVAASMGHQQKWKN